MGDKVQMENMQKYLLAILVDNKPGVLTHVSGLISRRAFNIESISAGYTEEPEVTRINIVVSVESDRELEQVVTQLGKLIDVIKIVNLTKLPSISRELVLIKIKAGKESRADIKNIVEIFRAKICSEDYHICDFFRSQLCGDLIARYGYIAYGITGTL